MIPMHARNWRLWFALLLTMIVAACSGTQPVGEQQTTEEIRNRQGGRLFGDAFTFGNLRRRADDPGAAAGGGIGVNTYLWRASLDTVAFMPLASADPFGGVIITDWYAPAESTEERFKVTVYILDRELRSDGVRASVFRQVLDQQRGWSDATVAPDTAPKLEDAILTRARQLRIAQTGN